MVQYKIFQGTLEEIEAAFNVWAASLVAGVNISASALVSVDTDAGQRWIKEVLYVLPHRSNARVLAPVLVRPNGKV